MAKSDSGITRIGTVGAFLNGRACSDTLLYVLNRAFGSPSKFEESAAVTFAGGLKQHGYQCGMIWGATLAAGAQAHRLFGPGPQAEAGAVIAAQGLVESFRALNQQINCLEITHLDKSSSAMKMVTFFLIKGGAIGCFRMAARYAPVAYEKINSALSENRIEAPASPASCAAVVAQKMGASDLHTVMAAGLAGGIGLCGGACGALGAAIWITAMNCIEEGVGDNLWKSKVFSARFDEMIGGFLKSSDYKFECAEIVGRKFVNVGDHAAYLREGGCANIIEAIAG